uniref:Serpin domain-containing protein n=1 Tax=Anopheles atroparvus TaxID=41427 RepID=A0AAG5DFI8_ANOAO
MRSGYVASWMLVVVVVMLATMQTVSAASGQANGMKKVIQAKQDPLDRLQANPASVNQVSDSVTNLAQKIARSIASPKSKTEIFSPVSIAGALSLLLLGAGGQTQRELLNVMGFGEGTAKLSFQEIHYAFGRLFQDLVANDPSLVPLVTWRVNDKCNRYDEDYEDDDFPPANTTANTSPSHLISVVNGMFLQNGLKPANRLLAVIQMFYQSNVTNLDFERDPSSAAAQINDWCARETNGKIREMVTAQMVANSRMIVASALYFKAQWETTFSPYGTRPRPFYLNGRQEPPIDLETMATTGCFPYFDATAYGAQIIGLPYETGISTMYIVMPNNSTRLELQRLQTILGAAQLNWMIDQMKTKKGMVVLPKLSISNRIQLSSVLQQLGVRDLFDPSR